MDLGMSRAAIGRRVARGSWRSVGYGVYLSGERQFTDAARLRAAVLGAGKGACAFGPSAAWWHGIIDRAPGEVWLNTPGSRYVKRGNGINARRRDLQWRDVEKIRGLPVTVLPLAVLEACVLVSNGSQLMDRALQRHTTLPILQAVHEMHAGRRGSDAVGRLLRTAAEGGHSEAERILLRLLRSAGITGWRTHVSVGRFEVDVAFVRARVVIEVDGWAWHRGVDRFDHDAERQNVLINAGWHVLRFTYHRLVGDPVGVIADIEKALSHDLSR
jgi:very-short-patch-repair endonuclease